MSSTAVSVNDIDKAIVALFTKRDTPHLLNKNDLFYIPKSFLIFYESKIIQDIWHVLPAHLQEDIDLQQYLICYKHFDNTNVECTYDGPLPMKIKCYLCNPVENLLH